MNFLQAVKNAVAGNPIKRMSWADPLTIQSCTCPGGKKHFQCPEPALMFPNYVDPKLTCEDILAEDWVVYHSENS